LAVRETLLATTRMLRDYGPPLGRPYVDMLKGSKFANMKELRFAAVYRGLIATADERYAAHLARQRLSSAE
jgi:hypothetical protein